MPTTEPSSSTTTGSIDTFARICSNRLSEIGIPAISAGPCNGSANCRIGSGAHDGSCSCSHTAGGSHSCSSASAARCSNGAHASPLAGFIRSVSRVIVASNSAPITSGNWPRTCRNPLSFVHHIRSDRAACRLRESSALGFETFLARRPSSIGSTFGARAAHSRSDSSSARRTTELSCSSEKPPSNATRPISGNDSSARAVSTLSRTVRADSPCAPIEQST